jgi:hypothetical protein
MKVNIYIEFWILKVKCTQYGIREQVAFKNARTIVISKSGRRATIFGRVQKKFGFSGRAVAPARIYLPYKFMGGTLTSPISWVGWGWSFVTWVRWVVLGGCRVLLLFTLQCFASKGFRLPSEWASFFFLGIFLLALAVLAFCLSKKKKKEKRKKKNKKSVGSYSNT